VSALGWICFLGTLVPGAALVWWAGFLSGRRYESGIWERWTDREAEAQEATKKRRGVRLKSMRIKR
jgi:hypothetical protein